MLEFPSPPSLMLCIIFAQHCVRLDFDIVGQIVHPFIEKAFQEWLLIVNFPIFARGPILIKDEQIGMLVASVQIIVDAAMLLTGLWHKILQNSLQFAPFFGL